MEFYMNYNNLHSSKNIRECHLQNLSHFVQAWICWHSKLYGTNTSLMTPDSKVYGANMGSTWGRQGPGGPHVVPMNFAIWDLAVNRLNCFKETDIYVGISNNWSALKSFFKLCCVYINPLMYRFRFECFLSWFKNLQISGNPKCFCFIYYRTCTGILSIGGRNYGATKISRGLLTETSNIFIQNYASSNESIYSSSIILHLTNNCSK